MVYLLNGILIIYESFNGWEPVVNYGNLVKSIMLAYNKREQEWRSVMQTMALKINHLLENLEAEDYDKAVSYIEFLASTRKKEKIEIETMSEAQEDVGEIIRSLTGILPDTGKSLEEYRSERLKEKYEICL